MTDNVVECHNFEAKDGVCSFCSVSARVVQSPVEDKTICFKCIYKINFQLGKLPAGAVCCFKCKAMSGFIIHTKQDMRIEYFMTGRDFKGCVKYEAKSKRKVPQRVIVKATCASCSSTIPTWMLDFTSHV